MWVLNIPHRQWLYRNSRIHIRHIEGLSLAEHDDIIQKVRTLIGTDPMDLLPQHRRLLEIDYEALGAGSSIDRQYWIAQMDLAINSRKRKNIIITEKNSGKRYHRT